MVSAPRNSSNSCVYEDGRIEVIEGDFWVGYDRALSVLDTLEAFFHRPKRQRPLNVALIGGTNTGKSMILDRFKRLHPSTDDPNEDKIELPVIAIEHPSAPDEKRLYNEFLQQLCVPIRRNEPPEEKLHTIVAILNSLNTKLIIIDEFNKMLAGSTIKQQQHMNAIRSLGNLLRIPIVVAGTESVRNALMADPQLANRFETIRLDKWEYGIEYRRFLLSIEHVFNLRQESNLGGASIAKKILALSEGPIGEVVNLLRRAAIHAIRSGEERITEELLDNIGWIKPSRRHRNHS